MFYFFLIFTSPLLCYFFPTEDNKCVSAAYVARGGDTCEDRGSVFICPFHWMIAVEWQQFLD